MNQRKKKKLTTKSDTKSLAFNSMRLQTENNNNLKLNERTRLNRI